VDDIDRRLSISTQLDKYTEEYSFFDAIEPHNLLEESKHKESKLTLGEVCCALSHVAIYKDIVKSELGYAVIIEDDAKIYDSIKKYSKKLESLHKRFDVIILGYSKVDSRIMHKMQFIRPLLRLTFDNIKVGFPYKQWKCGTVAYSISNKGAEKLQRVNCFGTNTADDWNYFEENDLLIGHFIPPFISEDFATFGSSLEKDRNTFKSRNIFMRYMAGVIRHLYLPLRYIQYIKRPWLNSHDHK
ncbi:glycosyltransferase family 25 protein, partial [Pluralibacter gergoviae]|nr:glycosyltransferase family 25 protein [Pluralibacter gergoviae]